MSDSATPWTTALQASMSITNSQSLLKFMSIKSVMSFNHLILCRPLLLLPSIFLSIRVFSNESVLCIRLPKYWFQLHHQSFQWIFRTDFLRIDWFDLPAVQGTLKSLLQHHNSSALSLLYGPTLTPILNCSPCLWLYGPLLAKWCLCFLICCLICLSQCSLRGWGHHPQWFWSPRK